MHFYDKGPLLLGRFAPEQTWQHKLTAPSLFRDAGAAVGGDEAGGDLRTHQMLQLRGS